MDEEQLWTEFRRNPSVENRNRLVERYHRLVQMHARKIMARTPPGVPFDEDDLVGYGVFGLVYAINAFDAARGTKFTSYSALRIRGAMLDGIRELDPMGRLNRRRLAAIFELQETEQIRPEDAALRLGISHSELRLAIEANAIARPGSLDTVIASGTGDHPITVADVKAIDLRAPEETDDRREQLRELLRGCSKAERLVMIGYYYLGQTMREIADSLDLSESRVSQMHSRIIERLRERIPAPRATAVRCEPLEVKRLGRPPQAAAEKRERNGQAQPAKKQAFVPVLQSARSVMSSATPASQGESRIDLLVNFAPKPEDLELVNQQLAELDAKRGKLLALRKMLEKVLKPKAAGNGSLIKRMVLHLQEHGPANAEQLATALGVKRQHVTLAASKSPRVKVFNDGTIRVAQ